MCSLARLLSLDAERSESPFRTFPLSGGVPNSVGVGRTLPTSLHSSHNSNSGEGVNVGVGPGLHSSQRSSGPLSGTGLTSASVANEASVPNQVLPGEGVGLKRALRGLLMSVQLVRVCACVRVPHRYICRNPTEGFYDKTLVELQHLSSDVEIGKMTCKN